MGDEKLIINVYKYLYFMLDNVDELLGHFLQCAIFLVLSGKIEFFGINFPSHLRSHLQLLTLFGKKNRTMGKVQLLSARSDPQPSHPHDIAPPPHCYKR